MGFKYIQSFTEFESSLNGVFVPKGQYSVLDQNMGKSSVVKISDEDYDKLKKDRIFNNFVKNNKVKILDILPDSLMNPLDRIATLQQKIDELVNENARLTGIIERAKARSKTNEVT